MLALLADDIPVTSWPDAVVKVSYYAAVVLAIYFIFRKD
jgi:hypothetical protein